MDQSRIPILDVLLIGELSEATKMTRAKAGKEVWRLHIQRLLREIYTGVGFRVTTRDLATIGTLLIMIVKQTEHQKIT